MVGENERVFVAKVVKHSEDDVIGDQKYSLVFEHTEEFVDSTEVGVQMVRLLLLLLRLLLLFSPFTPTGTYMS